MNADERLNLAKQITNRLGSDIYDDPYLSQQALFLVYYVLHGGVFSVGAHDDNAQDFFNALRLKFPYDHEIYEFIDVVDDDGNTIDWKGTI